MRVESVINDRLCVRREREMSSQRIRVRERVCVKYTGSYPNAVKTSMAQGIECETMMNIEHMIHNAKGVKIQSI